MIKIKLEDRFTDVELFDMFNVKCGDGWLWKVTTKRGSKIKRIKHHDDRIKMGVTIYPPGSKQRVEDLVKFYGERSQFEESAFDI